MRKLLPGISACAALPLFAAAASPDSRDIRFPWIQDTHQGQVYVWSPGVRRAPEFLLALQRVYAADLRQAAANSTSKVRRVTVEEMATPPFESITIVTFIDGAEVARKPMNWDLAEKRSIGWDELLKNSTPGSPAISAIEDSIHRHLSTIPAKPNRGDTEAASDRQARSKVNGRLVANPLPGFALVPAKDGKSVAGLLLFLGKPVPFGTDTSDTESHAKFIPASLLKPWLADRYRDLFGGEPALFHEDQREALEEHGPGMSAIILTLPQRPARTLSFRGEAPEVYFNDGTIDVVADEAKSTFAAQGHEISNARSSGVAWGMRVFEVTIHRKLDPFWSVCYDPDGLHLKAAKGSPADLAKIAPITLNFPMKYDCGDFGG